MSVCVSQLEFHIPDKDDINSLSSLCPVVVHSGDSIRPAWHIGERKTFNYLWVFIGSGHGIFKVNGNEFEVKENDFIWIPPDTLHEMRGTSEQMHCIWAHIDLMFDFNRSRLFCVPGGVRNLSQWQEYIHPPTGLQMIDSLCGLIKVPQPELLKSSFSDLCRVHRQSPDKLFLLAGILLEMLEQILHEDRQTNLLDVKLDNALIYIRNHLNDNLDVKQLAKTIGLSPSYFRSIFKIKYGVTPVRLHRRLRIRRSIEMLEYEGANISEASNLLGFSKVSGFSRAFKEVMHMSPLHFLRNKP